MRDRKVRGQGYTTALLATQQEASLDGILTVDAHGRIVSFNTRFADLWEMPDEILDMRSDERALEFVLSKVAAAESFIKRVRQIYSRRSEHARDEILLKDGRTFDRYSAPIIGPRGRYHGRIWYFRDVTDRLKVEESRRSTEARYRQLFEAEGDAAFVVDVVSRRVEDANRAAVRQLGYSKNELANLYVEDLDCDPSDVIQKFRHLAKGGGLIPVLVRKVKRQDGTTFPAELSAGLFQEAGKLKLIGTLRDMSERFRAAEAEVLRQRAEVQKELVATVSHELRTPIAAIKGFAETLLGGALADPQWNREFTTTILRHADRLTRLVDDLLAFSMLESGRQKTQTEPVDVSKLVWDFIAGMEPVVRGRRQKLVARMPRHLQVLVDPAQVTQVLQNLADNACKFGKPNDTVRIEAERVEGFALLKVIDSGPGIPESEVQRIFEPFHRIDDARKKAPGAGLGLAIARQIVQAHGGRIWAERRPQGGSIFAFTLPLV